MTETIPNPLLKRAFLTPNRPMIRFKDRDYSFKEMYERALKQAGHLQSQGVKKGDYVAVLLQNHVDSVVMLLSLQLIGGIAVILNNRLTAEELAWQIEDSNSILFITEEGFRDKLARLQLEIPWLWKATIDTSNSMSPAVQDEVNLDDVCSVMYTSGTTGKPKGVLQTYGNHWWSATGSALNLGISEDDCWLCTVPLFHISGFSILMRSIIYGMRMVLHEGFNEGLVLETIETEKVTIMSVVTTMLSRLVEALNHRTLPSRFRCMLLGGGPAPLPLLEKCVEKNIPVFQSYGMTETSSQIVTLSPEYSISKLGSAGKALFPSQVKIADSNGKEIEANQSGEILVKGPNVTSGYLNREVESRKQFVDGWLKTGDVGYLDEEGFLYVLDRRSDLIISGGENIYPAEIEGILTSHPDIEDAGVIGAADHQWGQVPVAFVKKIGSVAEEEIIHYCSERLARYKLPKKIYFVDELPRNASRKLLRRELRQMLDK
ncbi:o-succinylbenzoate--CoA ligase [Robertmurraya andreesenii]|uniref:2-succinylbenzoate--CoA ligase n=1 Tax=Anoxybacillus andreesenii TaxID=1325932 RepID=A0ABT9VA51_9BACL|nr:o-succinylbenzoate--CoA ligase [Robertmurraya andreesenii]MDQ0157840.1 O-succinylbenzoic acid--CoA ligase [Robertmurraya andreesenii]